MQIIFYWSFSKLAFSTRENIPVNQSISNMGRMIVGTENNAKES